MRKPNKNTITVYEHDTIGLRGGYAGKITADQLKVLREFSGANGVPYFNLINDGVKFNKFVGVLQVGKLTIEVLPKVDKANESEKSSWKRILIDMLRKVGLFEVSVSSESDLNIKTNSILDLYIESFLKQVEYLLHLGLIKKYRKSEANSTALKGKIVFSKHLSKNIIHKERFFVNYTVYDHAHKLNKILYKTLILISYINTNPALQSKVGALILNFPEMCDINVSDSLFSNMVFDRKSEPYRQAIVISRLLLLNYHPDINSGRDHVLALMFDMNLLWEKFVYVSLRKHFKDGKVEQQSSKPYWKLNGKRAVSLKPDVVLIKNNTRYVLDTKWKLPGNSKPGPGDLQQMYAYTKYFNSDHTLLCYPGKDDSLTSGHFYDEEKKDVIGYPCSVMRITFDPQKSINEWQERICQQVDDNLNHIGI